MSGACTVADRVEFLDPGLCQAVRVVAELAIEVVMAASTGDEHHAVGRYLFLLVEAPELAGVGGDRAHLRARDRLDVERVQASPGRVGLEGEVEEGSDDGKGVTSRMRASGRSTARSSAMAAPMK